MKTATSHPLPRMALLWALRAGIGLLFLYTGVIKLADPSAFAIEIHNYQLFPDASAIGAATLPAIEIVLGAALLVGPRRWARAGALGTGALMLVFTVAVTSVVLRGINISCGCFGAGSGPVTALTVIRDVALLAACVVIYALTAEPRPDGASGDGPTG